MSARRRWTKWRGQPRPGRLVDPVVVVGQAGEGRVEQAHQGPERALVAGVRGGGDQDEVAGRVCGQVGQQSEPLVGRPPPPHVGRAGVGLVDDDQLRGGAQELVAAAVALDEVGGDDGVGVDVEDALPDSRATAPGGWPSRTAPARLRCGTSWTARPAIARPGAAGRARPAAGLGPIPTVPWPRAPPRPSCRYRRRRR